MGTGNQYLQGTITVPSFLLITAATRANPMVITVSTGSSSATSNNYVVGMAVKLTVPISYGMFQADGMVGTITNISGSDFTLDIDSSTFDAFTASPSSIDPQPASIAPAGVRNYTYGNGSRPTAFQALNNKGN